jgi:tRNA G37 N-methylase Trm5
MYRDIPPRSCSAKWCRKATWPGKRKETSTFWKRWDISGPILFINHPAKIHQFMEISFDLHEQVVFCLAILDKEI